MKTGKTVWTVPLGQTWPRPVPVVCEVHKVDKTAPASKSRLPSQGLESLGRPKASLEPFTIPGAGILALVTKSHPRDRSQQVLQPSPLTPRGLAPVTSLITLLSNSLKSF